MNCLPLVIKKVFGFSEIDIVGLAS